VGRAAAASAACGDAVAGAAGALVGAIVAMGADTTGPLGGDEHATISAASVNPPTLSSFPTIPIPPGGGPYGAGLITFTATPTCTSRSYTRAARLCSLRQP
jgi:hypothetical protein